MPKLASLPQWLDPAAALAIARRSDSRLLARALETATPELADLAALLAPRAPADLEAMAQRAQELTRHHFGRTIGLYIPLYLSDYCSGGCVYCGFAADRRQPRRRLEPPEIIAEMEAIQAKGFEEILLLTGARTPQADFDYLLQAVTLAAERFHLVTIETFAMSTAEYAQLAQAGCTGLTLYQETYDPAVYQRMHRWGNKRDYTQRLEAPERALAAGLRTVGLGVLLGLADPLADALALYRHLIYLRKNFWRAGLALAFPRIRPQAGGFAPPCPVDERYLAQLIWAFRICLPDVPLTLSTREPQSFRDGIAGVGINKMSVTSKTTVGGYHSECAGAAGQFLISDNRSLDDFCAMLRAKGLEPVFKNWEAVYRDAAP